MPKPILPARRIAASRAPAIKKAPAPTKGLDPFDKFLIGATKLGLFALFGLFIAARYMPKPTPLAPTPASVPPRRSIP